MPLRDQLEALHARVEAQTRELEDVRSELDTVREAHARQVRVSEHLGAALEELTGAGDVCRPQPTPRLWPMLVPLAVFGLLPVFFALASLGTMPPPRAAATSASSSVTPLTRTGRVVATEGTPAVAGGAQCTVERIPVHAGSFDSRVEVRCGDEALYGFSELDGYLRCAGREVCRDLNVSINDGDPAITVDLARGLVTVQERTGLDYQRVEIALDPVTGPITD